MELIIQYENEEYLVILTEFSKTNKTVEVFRFFYSNEENDWFEFKIEVFLRVDNDFVPKKIKDLSAELKEVIAKIIEKDLGRTFIANPYFDELLIFFGKEIYTHQEQFKPIQCDQCDKKNLYEKRNKGNKSAYIEEIIKLMGEDKNLDWPFKERLLVQFSVSNVQSKLDKIDLDNLSKTMFDIFKGLIYLDDSQIVSFAADKTSVNDIKAFIVAIKRLEPNERPLFQEYLFSGKMNAWKEEREKKQQLNKPTRFIAYGTFKNN